MARPDELLLRREHPGGGEKSITRWRGWRVLGGVAGTLLALGVAFLILGLSLFRSARAVTGSSVEVTPTLSVTPTGAVVSYYLPYPGILPDHFLYSVKMARDFIRKSLTFNTLKKARLYILYADKRLNAARFLLEGNKQGLATTTAVKAEKYLERAFREGEKAEGRGLPMGNFWKEMQLAAAKHEEVLTQLNEQVPVTNRNEWGKARELAKMVGDKTRQKRIEQEN